MATIIIDGQPVDTDTVAAPPEPVEEEEEGLPVPAMEMVIDGEQVEAPMTSPSFERKTPVKDALTELGAPASGFVLQALLDSPKLVLGTGEFILSMATDLTGALGGVYEAGLDALTPDEEDARRVAAGIPGNSPASRKFIEKLPLTVTERMGDFHIGPFTEGGERIAGAAEALFTEVREFGEFLGEETFEATGSPGLATTAQIAPEAAIMLFPALKGGKLTRKAAKGIINKIRAKKATGRPVQTFPDQVVGQFDRLSPRELAEEAAGHAELKRLYRLPRKDVGAQRRIGQLEFRLDEIAKKKQARSQNITKQNMRPDEILHLATEEQVAGVRGDIFINVLDKGTREPVKMIREGGKLRIADGLEKAQVAKVLGEEKVPVEILEKGLTPELRSAKASRVTKTIDAARKRKAAIDKRVKGTLTERFVEATVDRQHRVKKQLIKANKEAGENAVMQLELMQGATTASRLAAQNALDRIYRGLNKAEEATLDNYIRARRVIEIDTFKRAKGKPHKFEGGLRMEEYKAWLEQSARDLGPTKHKRFMDLADQYFGTQRKLLDMLYNEGLLSKKRYNRLRQFDYEPTRYLEEIDPLTQSVGPRGEVISVPDSGVQYLSGGRTSLIEMSSRELMLESIFRTYQRVFKNKTNQKLMEFAQAEPKNGMVRLLKENEKFPQNQGLVKIDVVKDGKTHTMAATEGFAQQWIQAVPEMSSYATNFLRWISGTPIVKGAAVGYNPAFFITDFPRNVAHVYAASGRSFKGVPLYSAIAPRYLTQIAIDMTKVFGDMLKKKGIYEDLINEGGAPAFLAHIGRGELIENVGGLKKLGRPWARVGQKLAAVNEFSELLMRGAVMQRALKAGLSKTEAAYEARRVIDYAQAGRATKVVDQFIPFLNPAMQATRTSFRLFRDPKRAASVVAQVMGGTGLLYLSNRALNSEGLAQVPDEDLATGLVFVMPPWMATKNADGDVIHPYIYIKTENIFMPMIGGVNYAMRRVLDGREPTGMGTAIIGHTMPLTPSGAVPPTLDAALKVMGNKDFWFDRDVWEGAENIEPWAEYHEQHKRNATPPYYRWMGQFMAETVGLGQADITSPERLRAAVDTMVADHPFSNIGGQVASRVLWGDTPDNVRYQSMGEWWASQPGIRRVFRFAHPSRNLFTDLEEIKTGVPTERKIMNDQADRLATGFLHNEVPVERLREFLNNEIPPTERERVATRMQVQIKIDNILNKMSEGDRAGIPPRSWWVAVGSGTHGRDRARAFYNYWRNLEMPEKRRSMERIAQGLSVAGVGVAFWNRDFALEFDRLKSEEDNHYGYGFGATKETLPSFKDEDMKK